MKSILSALFLLLLPVSIWSQSYIHTQSTEYEWPTDEKVKEKLTKWQDLKFGIILHWGVYSVPGICESWTLTSEDWITPDTTRTYEEYKKWYWGLSNDFNPKHFDPDQWADIALKAGMKYMVFTTKHHDGFCLFDSKQTDYTVTHSGFANNPKSDVARYIFDAFRKKGIMTGCYFSKPDWHSPYYWWPSRATNNRSHNYSIAQYPDRWHKYKQFVYNQIEELMKGYGPLDILWLDGGWCTAPREDIGLDSIVDMARQYQPGLIVVERSCPGKNENYQTPEQKIPDGQILTPWESCITLTDDWGWVSKKSTYKSPARIIALLAEVVAKGGNLLLGVGPTPDGLIEERSKNILLETGDWLKKNGEAIYTTKPAKIYTNREGNVWFTKSKDDKYTYAIITRKNDTTSISPTMEWEGNIPKKNSKITTVDKNITVKWELTDDGKVRVMLPEKLLNDNGIALKMETNKEEIYESAISIEQQKDSILGRMTLEEKIGQLVCPLGWDYYAKNTDSITTFAPIYPATKNSTTSVGTLWATQRADPWTQKTLTTGLSPRESADATNKIQKWAADSTRLGIPIWFAEEAPHGHMAIGATVFPTGLAQASTFDKELMTEMGHAIGQEIRARGAHIAYGPVLDLARDPRWSRTEETLGEDPYLTGCIGASIVAGERQAGVLSTLKHFAAYGIPEGGLNGERANIGRTTLLNEYLPPFHRAICAGTGAVMASYNSIDGTPCSANRWLLSDILRKDWGFRGIVFSDLHSIEGIANTQNCADNVGEAARMAIKAGVDIDLEGNAYGKTLAESVENGFIDEAVIDTAVSRVLMQKMESGLFDRPFVDENEADKIVRSKEHKTLALQVAREGIVLLKNDGTLPLDKNIRRIAVIGPNADNIYNQLGDYTAPQEREAISTVLDGVKELAPNAEIRYAYGCAIRDTTRTNIEEAVSAARQSDVAIVVVGGSSARDFQTSYSHTGAADASVQKWQSDMECGEGYDRASLRLMGDQEKLIEAITQTGVPTVVVYIEGRPLNMNLASQKADALLTAWYPGEQGGRAIAEVLFGQYNPAGRLPISIPRNEGQLPVFYSKPFSHDYIDSPSSPLYPFGYGLSYTSFAYSDIETTSVPSDSILCQVSCTITNTGKRDGEEVVQLYVNDVKSSVEISHLQLRGFQRVSLHRGESKKVTFALTKDELGLYNADGRFVVEPGVFKLMIGASSNDIRLKTDYIYK